MGLFFFTQGLNLYEMKSILANGTEAETNIIYQNRRQCYPKTANLAKKGTKNIKLTQDNHSSCSELQAF
jgi:hypothetical protein